MNQCCDLVQQEVDNGLDEPIVSFSMANPVSAIFPESTDDNVLSHPPGCLEPFK